MTTNIKAGLGLLLAVLAAGAFAVASSAGSTSPRSGELHVTKECSQYFGQAGQFCTITSSNLNAIRPGTNVVYASAAGATALNSDLVLDGPGNNNANGHVTLNFLTATAGQLLRRNRPVQRIPRQRRRHLQPNRRPLALGRHLRLHPARPQTNQLHFHRVRRVAAGDARLSPAGDSNSAGNSVTQRFNSAIRRVRRMQPRYDDAHEIAQQFRVQLRIRCHERVEHVEGE